SGCHTPGVRCRHGRSDSAADGTCATMDTTQTPPASNAMARGLQRHNAALGPKEPGKVATAVQHPDNVNATPGTAVEDEIIPDEKSPQAGSQVVTGRPDAGMGGQQRKPVGDVVDESVGGGEAALFDDIQPDGV